jgi:hypothetical protein
VPSEELRSFAGEVLADANEALSRPLTEDERAEWFHWLGLVEAVLALDREFAEVELRMARR